MAYKDLLNFDEFFCCILSPQLGAAINGSFLALLSIFGNIPIFLINFEDPKNTSWLILLEFMAISTFFVSGFLMAGIRNGIPNFLLPWLLMIPFNYVLVCCSIWKYMNNTDGSFVVQIIVIVALILFMAYIFYSWISVYIYFRQQILNIQLQTILPLTSSMPNNMKKSNSLSTKVTSI